MEATNMKALSLISTGVLVLLLGAVAPTYAQGEKQEEAKPAAKQEAKPAAKQEAKPAAKQEAKPAAKQEAKPAAKQEAKPAAKQEAKPAAKQEAAHAQQSQGQYAKNGQKDSRGHEYSTSKFGPDHHTRFVATGGRLYNGRREYSYGGYWF